MKTISTLPLLRDCWKLDRECHVDFCMFLTPHELNFELLMKTLKRKMKRNAWKLSCILLFWNTVFIRSCPVVYVLYRDLLYASETILDETANSTSADFSCNNQYWTKHIKGMSRESWLKKRFAFIHAPNVGLFWWFCRGYCWFTLGMMDKI